MQNNQTIKLSVLEAMEISPARVLAPLEADIAMYQPPTGLLIAGFKWDVSSEQLASGKFEISEDLIDTVVAWATIGNNAKFEHEAIEPVIELQYDKPYPWEQVAQLASQGEFSIALVGWNGAEQGREAYHQALYDLSREVLKLSAFTKRLYPFSLYFEEIFMEKMGRVSEASFRSEQIAKGVVDIIHPSAARFEYGIKRASLGHEGLKSVCLKALIDHYGSEVILDDVMIALSKPIVQRLEHFADEIVQKHKPKVYAQKMGEQIADRVSDSLK